MSHHAPSMVDKFGITVVNSVKSAHHMPILAKIENAVLLKGFQTRNAQQITTMPVPDAEKMLTAETMPGRNRARAGSIAVIPLAFRRLAV